MGDQEEWDNPAFVLAALPAVIARALACGSDEKATDGFEEGHRSIKAADDEHGSSDLAPETACRSELNSSTYFARRSRRRTRQSRLSRRSLTRTKSAIARSMSSVSSTTSTGTSQPNRVSISLLVSVVALEDKAAVYLLAADVRRVSEFLRAAFDSARQSYPSCNSMPVCIVGQDKQGKLHETRMILILMEIRVQRLILTAKNS
jgi:hypothetical protein